jgi:hypothetical protein
VPVLSCPVPKQDWAAEVAAHNVVSAQPPEQPTDQSFADAGAWEAAVQKIVSFQHLGDNWDGYGAKAPSRELLESAIGLAYTLYQKGVQPPQCVVAGLDGSVSFEWQDADGTIAEVEIDRPFHAEVMVMEPGRPPRFWTLPTE